MIFVDEMYIVKENGRPVLWISDLQMAVDTAMDMAWSPNEEDRWVSYPDAKGGDARPDIGRRVYNFCTPDGNTQVKVERQQY
jgi:hypothetical protein